VITKRFRSFFLAPVAALAVWGASSTTLAQTIYPTEQDIDLPGSPFAAAVSVDGQYAFASLSGNANGIAIIKQDQVSASLVRVLDTGGGTFGLTVTPDGKYLLDTVQAVSGGTTPSGAQIIDIKKAIAGASDAILGTIPTGTNSGPIEVALSNDDQFIFVTNEDNETVSVINFKKALASGENASSIVGTIPVEQLPVGLAFSRDGRYLYVSNEEANSTDPGYSATACNIPTGIGTGTTPGPEGTLSVISIKKAETDPANSVLASVYAGCSPVRVVLSADSSVAWVTARAQDDVLAFSTAKLLTDPSDALISTTPVGTAPVGIQLFDNDKLIAVANSNRFTVGQTGTVSILNYSDALKGDASAATLGTFPAGDFPRQWALSNSGQFLYLTEFSSNLIAIFQVRGLEENVGLAK
jgi:DNA-binding beta-propeller fold protein YncE